MNYVFHTLDCWLRHQQYIEGLNHTNTTDIWYMVKIYIYCVQSHLCMIQSWNWYTLLLAARHNDKDKAHNTHALSHLLSDLADREECE